MITFAIGDVHGCLTELQELMRQVGAFIEKEALTEIRFVFVGDYVDRGLDSKGVIDYIIELAKTQEVIALRGNHEQMMLDDYSNGGSRFGSAWLHNGGDITLKSFGAISIVDVDPTYIQWMKDRPLFFDDGLRFFVHAGVVSEPLERNSQDTMLWARQEFYNQRRAWSRYIVFGHTPIEFKATEHFVGIDQGCVFGGHITCAVFNDEKKEPVARFGVKGPEQQWRG